MTTKKLQHDLRLAINECQQIIDKNDRWRYINPIAPAPFDTTNKYSNIPTNEVLKIIITMCQEQGMFEKTKQEIIKLSKILTEQNLSASTTPSTYRMRVLLWVHQPPPYSLRYIYNTSRIQNFTTFISNTKQKVTFATLMISLSYIKNPKHTYITFWTLLTILFLIRVLPQKR